jgi:hypothetical protein
VSAALCAHGTAPTASGRTCTVEVGLAFADGHGEDFGLVVARGVLLPVASVLVRASASLALPSARPVPAVSPVDGLVFEPLGALDRLSLGVGVGLALDDGEVSLGEGDALCEGGELGAGELVIECRGAGLGGQTDELGPPAVGAGLLAGFDPLVWACALGPPLLPGLCCDPGPPCWACSDPAGEIT